MITYWNEAKATQAQWQLDFDKQGDLFALHCAFEDGQMPCALVGLGEAEKLTPLLVRRAVAVGVRHVQRCGAQGLVIRLKALTDMFGDKAAEWVYESAALCLYKPQNWKTKENKKTLNVYLDLPEGEKDFDKLASIAALAESVCMARDMVNEPANMLTPEVMTTRMAKLAEEAGCAVEILDEKQMEALGMGALLAVGGSAEHQPRMAVLRYTGNPGNKETIGLVGKGITCDTGGYCLKPVLSMKGIRGDMAGAAAVFGCVVALAKNKVPVNVVAVIPAAENLISRESFLVGDVVTSMSGKTIEIGNTDAEGRLILADAMTYAVRKAGATRLVDIATLTGGVVQMFGFTTAGVMSNDDAFYTQFEQATHATGEQYWRLPTFAEYGKMNDSHAADIKNNSDAGCATISAGMFLNAFNEGLPWIHLDIAGTAWVSTHKWEFQAPGATGAGVAALYALCESFAE